ncbi:MAG: ORF6N domain-containing protein [Bacteriovorax sp.]|nr:ORF6N domain-containing protein [Bacteriovorax sp.]
MEKVSIAKIEKMIYIVRGQKVMQDSDLADLYEVETRIFNQAIRRNLDRFPSDFMFELTQEETDELYTYLGNTGKHGGRRKKPLVFTENGVAMLSSVLNSKRAVQVNISIMRTFTKLRSFLLMENDITSRMNKLEDGTNKLFKVVFQRLDEIEDRLTPQLTPKRKKLVLLRIK